MIHDSVIKQSPLDPHYIKQYIRAIENWPEPGVTFRDITPVLQMPKPFRVLIDLFVHRYMDANLTLVAGMDARGFILGSVIAYELNLGFIPIRKKGKLPFETFDEDYELEYGSASVEMHIDACFPKDRVLLVDDLIATGGTMMAGMRLLQRTGATVVEGAAIVSLPQLGGVDRLKEAGLGIYSICEF